MSFLYAYEAFILLDPTEFTIYNKDLLDHNVRVFALATLTNGAGESYGCLFYNINDGSIFLNSEFNSIAAVNLHKVSKSLTELFCGQMYEQVLIARDDKNFWGWYESVYHQYDVDRAVPKGVLPDFDLRAFFRDEIKGTFLMDHKYVGKFSLLEYLKSFDVINPAIGPAFDIKPFPEDVSEFIDEINNKLGSRTFYAAYFPPSEFWGVGNFKLLNDEEKQLLHKFGILTL